MVNAFDDDSEELRYAMANGYGQYQFPTKDKRAVAWRNRAMAGRDPGAKPMPEAAPTFLNPIQSGPDQASFLRSEKDTSPHYLTDKRGMFAPAMRNGYNAPDPSLLFNPFDFGGYSTQHVSPAMPEALGGHGAKVMHDIVQGKPLTPDEINHGAQGAANFMLVGGLAGNIGKRPQAGVMSSSGAQPPKFPLIPDGTFPSQTGLQSAMRQQGLRSHPSYEADVPVGSIRPLQPPSDMDPAKVAGLVGNFPSRDVNVSPELGVSLYRHGDQYYTMDGHHRAEAARQRGDATLPALVRDIYSNPKQGAIAPLAENAAKNLNRDVDGLGYYSAALEAAKNLPQAKGTPAMREQARKGLPLFMNPVTGAIVPLTGNAFDER